MKQCVYSKTRDFFLIVTPLAFFFSCSKKEAQNEYDAFLRKGEHVASNKPLDENGGDLPNKDTSKSNSPKKDGPFFLEGLFSLAPSNSDGEEDGASNKDGYLKVKTSEWDFAIREMARLKAELSAMKIDEQSRMRVEYERGYADGLKASDERLSRLKEELLGEASKTIDYFSSKTKAYRASSAIVSGECRALTKSGDRFLYSVQSECLKVVSKKVGNDGSITGITDAVSKRALDEGILTLDCDINRSHIHFIHKPCEAKK